jgi:hypothetical protein
MITSVVKRKSSLASNIAGCSKTRDKYPGGETEIISRFEREVSGANPDRGTAMPSKEWSDKNREKCRESGRRHYATHKDRVKGWVRNRERQTREWINSLKGRYRCACGEERIPCLDFHHATPGKVINIGDAVKHGWGKQRILDEIAGCKVICANCHRYLHWLDRTSKQETS